MKRRRRKAEEPPHSDDVPDPHVMGMELHGLAAEQITAGTAGGPAGHDAGVRAVVSQPLVRNFPASGLDVKCG